MRYVTSLSVCYSFIYKNYVKIDVFIYPQDGCAVCAGGLAYTVHLCVLVPMHVPSIQLYSMNNYFDWKISDV